MPQAPRVPPTAPARTARSKPRRPPIVPILIFLCVVGFILYQEVPAVHDAIEKQLRPAQWQAAQTCQQAALADASSPPFARVIKAGSVHATQAGHYVEAVQIGEMDASGREQRYSYSCYLDQAGALVSGGRDGAR